MSELSIKIKIADREYPMKVDADEEERLREASRQLNEQLKAYKQEYGIDDKQDLLAMVAFDAIADKMTAESANEDQQSSLYNKIQYLNQYVSQVL